MANQTSYHYQVGNPFYQMTMMALGSDEKYFRMPHIAKLLVKGWNEFGESGKVEVETTAVFVEYLRQNVGRLVALALERPEVFDQKVGELKRNYVAVVKKLLEVFIRNSQTLLTDGRPYNVKEKMHSLLIDYQTQFYRALHRRLTASPSSIAKEWSLFAVALRRRQLEDELARKPIWSSRCPFGTDFQVAFVHYSFSCVKKWMSV